MSASFIIKWISFSQTFSSYLRTEILALRKDFFFLFYIPFFSFSHQRKVSQKVDSSATVTCKGYSMFNKNITFKCRQMIRLPEKTWTIVAGIYLQLGCKEKSGSWNKTCNCLLSSYQPKFDYITPGGFHYQSFWDIYPYLGHNRVPGSYTQSPPYSTPHYLLWITHGPSQNSPLMSSGSAASLTCLAYRNFYLKTLI